MRKITRFTILTIIFVALIITQTGCSGEAKTVSRDNYYLDTTCNLTVYETGDGLDEDVANKAIDKAYELCALLDKTLSKTVEVSDISKINSAGGEWVQVSKYTYDLIHGGLMYSELSDGLFDITVGRLTDLWDFHATNPVLPDPDELGDAVQHVGYKMVETDRIEWPQSVDEDDSTDQDSDLKPYGAVRLTDPVAKIDLGGIAKGYIGDRMAEVLEENGVTSGIVNLGGNIICIGSKPRADGFNIGVEAPFSDRTEIVGSIEVADKTLVTSGVYERMFEIDGQIYHHILDTKTGYSVDSDLNAVTLIADKGKSMDCDAMSTICLIKGYKEARKFIESQDGIEAVFVLKNGDVKMTAGANLKQ